MFTRNSSKCDFLLVDFLKIVMNYAEDNMTSHLYKKFFK